MHPLHLYTYIASGDAISQTKLYNMEVTQSNLLFLLVLMLLIISIYFILRGDK